MLDTGWKARRFLLARLSAYQLLFTSLVAPGAAAAVGTAKAENPIDTNGAERMNKVHNGDEDVDRYDAPLVITEGGTYSGHFESHSSNVSAVTIMTSEPVIIENAVIRSAGHLISAPLVHANVTIRNVVGEALPPTRAGIPPGRFLHAEGYGYVNVENSTMTGTSGIYLAASQPGATVRIVGNLAFDIDGRLADGQGGYDGNDYVQFVQLNQGHDLVDSEIAWNQVVNRPGHSRVEDVISLYRTTGTAQTPIRIHHNYIRGAFPEDAATGAYSGGGIMLGDQGGAYQHAYENVVVGTSNYGVAISGGRHNRIDDNLVVSTGLLEDGTEIASQNVGMYIWNLHDEVGFRDNGGSGNRVAWAHHEHGRNDWWMPDAAFWRDNEKIDEGAEVAQDLITEAYQSWLAQATDAVASVGAPGTGPVF